MAQMMVVMTKGWRYGTERARAASRRFPEEAEDEAQAECSAIDSWRNVSDALIFDKH
jgi:hypothetical protein